MSKFVFRPRKSAFSPRQSVSQGGFSLLELLIYIGILGAVSGVLVGILSTVTTTQVQESSQNDVTGQLNFVTQTIQRLVRSSSLIELDAGVATTTLKLRMPNLVNDPTYVYLSNGQIYVKVTDTGSPQTITSNSVNVDSLQFLKLSQPPGKDTVQIDIALSAVQQASGKTISKALRTAVSRVSAATFDSDLLPNTDNAYNVGANPSSRWLNGAFSGALTIGGTLSVGTTAVPSGGVATFNGNVGIGTVAPSELLTLSLSDSSTSTAETILSINKLTTGTAAAGIGTSLNFRAQASDGTLIDIGQIKSIFTNASSTTPQSSIQLTSGNSLGIFINQFGNVGIGTAVPSTKLDISGDIRVGNNQPYHYSYTSNVGGWQTPKCSCDINSATQDCQKEFDSATDQGFICYDQWSNPHVIGDQESNKYSRSGGTNIALQTYSGNVGIGSSTSTSKLTVNGNASVGSSYIGNSAPANGIIIQGNVGIGMITAPVPLSVTGHIGFYGSAPSVSSCGGATLPSIIGTDAAGIITTGSLSSGSLISCTITFATPYNNPPACIANDNTAVLTLKPNTTATTLVITAPSNFSLHQLSYICSEINHAH
jgi:type II secretory pathway pseudopilin PulG